MKFIASSLFVVFLYGCTTVNQGNLSSGAQLMIETKLTTPRELQDIANKSENEKSLKKENDTAPTATLVMGSGVVESAAVYSSTGAWLNPKSLMSAPLLGSALIDSITDKGMKNHKWTYTYFFSISNSCDSRSCVNDEFKAFYSRLMDIYLPLNMPETRIEDAKPGYSGAIVVFNFIEGTLSATINGKRTGKLVLLSIRDVDRIGRKNGTKIWGNDSPQDFQDGIGLPGLNYGQITALLVEASKAAPDIYIFRGVDIQALKNKQSCRGGYFINNGKKIYVPEIGCETATGA